MTGAFFDLRIWQKAQKLAKEIYKITKLFSKDELFGLTNQLRRSAVSVAANIAESQGRYYYRDKIRVLYISRGEIYEIQSHLRITSSQNYLPNKKLENPFIA
ncbi:MAG: four helix bundle protein [Patescibacteria group bacterium]|nr:four helix bundle protein [Patescibacteria group bacterium]